MAVANSATIIEDKATALSDADMKKQASFQGWDFENVWAIDEGQSYPYLRWTVAQADPVVPVNPVDPVNPVNPVNPVDPVNPNPDPNPTPNPNGKNFNQQDIINTVDRVNASLPNSPIMSHIIHTQKDAKIDKIKMYDDLKESLSISLDYANKEAHKSFNKKEISYVYLMIAPTLANVWINANQDSLVFLWVANIKKTY